MRRHPPLWPHLPAALPHVSYSWPYPFLFCVLAKVNPFLQDSPRETAMPRAVPSLPGLWTQVHKEMH